MKKYLTIIILIISLLPIGAKAQQFTDAELQDICDNEIVNVVDAILVINPEVSK